MATLNQITPDQLLRLIGTPQAPEIIDVCIDEDFDQDPFLIPGSRRHRFDDLDGFKTIARDRAFIIACQKGKKLSQGVSAWLRSEGYEAEVLSGGKQAWRAHHNALCLDARAVPAPVGDATLWVTRHRPKIDRIACPWLIRRFVDRNARFLFVPASDVVDVAARFNATPFDVDGVLFSHRHEKCTFDAMLDRFGLASDALDHMARIVRAADTDRHDLAPEAAGLHALSIGLSRQYRNDSEQLKAGLALYDALFRWARDGQGEQHHSLKDTAA